MNNTVSYSYVGQTEISFEGIPVYWGSGWKGFHFSKLVNNRHDAEMPSFYMQNGYTHGKVHVHLDKQIHMDVDTIVFFCYTKRASVGRSGLRGTSC